MKRQRSYVFINIIGLSAGITCAVLIGVFIISEFSYDRFHEKGDRICRLYLDGKIGAQELKAAYTSAPMAKTFLERIPELENALRMTNWGETVVKYNDRSFIEEHFVLADSSFFQVFSIPLIKGDPAKVLAAPHKVVFTESAARKYFGSEDPVGKLIRIGTDTTYYEISGICRDVPANSHFEFNLLGSFMTQRRAEEGSWMSNSFSTYVLLSENAGPGTVEEKIQNIIVEKVGPELEQLMGITLEQMVEAGNRYGVYLQPLYDIHLNTEIEHEFKPSNSRKYTWIFIIVAVLILSLACINYMNLATARSFNRAREIGIRKVAGSDRKKLIIQFITESVLLSLLALVVSVFLIELLLPPFSNLVRSPMELHYFSRWYIIPGLILLAVLLGILAGSYPAFFLSRFNPVEVLTGGISKTGGKGLLRSILVIIQMVISILIILATLVIFRQVNFMLNKDLGFKKDQLLVIRNVHTIRNQIQTFIAESEKIPGVLIGSHSTAVPGRPNNNNGYVIEGRSSDAMVIMQTVWADEKHFQTYEFQLTGGRYFSPEFATDSFACVINESAVKHFALTDPFSTRFLRPTDRPEGPVSLQVIGVVKDFHFLSLHSRIEPSVFLHAGNNMNWGYISFQLQSREMEKTVGEIESLWRSFTNNDPMQYFFLDQDFANNYQEDIRTGKLSLSFAIIAILIASLGLFGLSSFSTERRTREIGIRKSHGASSWNILLMLSHEISRLVLISTLMAFPAGFYFMKKWLQNYPFRTGPLWIDFLLSIGLALLITWFTISYQSWKASRTNPADALRYE